MRYLLAILCLLFATWSGVQAQPVLKLMQKEYNLGQIAESGGTVTRVYKFRNEGNKPLVIVRAETACACTKASFSKKPVMPGQEGEITVTYNPRHQSGTFNKAISIYTNVPGVRYIVTLRGEVMDR
jgi:hypothetical protein